MLFFRIQIGNILQTPSLNKYKQEPSPPIRFRSSNRLKQPFGFFERWCGHGALARVAPSASGAARPSLPNRRCAAMCASVICLMGRRGQHVAGLPIKSTSFCASPHRHLGRRQMRLYSRLSCARCAESSHTTCAHRRRLISWQAGLRRDRSDGFRDTTCRIRHRGIVASDCRRW